VGRGSWSASAKCFEDAREDGKGGAAPCRVARPDGRKDDAGDPRDCQERGQGNDQTLVGLVLPRPERMRWDRFNGVVFVSSLTEQAALSASAPSGARIVVLVPPERRAAQR
jgi:hypothetical protein